jgi:hypothetical protein
LTINEWLREIRVHRQSKIENLADIGFGKRNRLHSAETERRRVNVKPLLLFLLCGGKRFLGGLRLGGALLEFVHAPGGVHELLLTGVERVAGVANADDDHGLGGAGLDLVAAGATDFRVHIFRMNVRLHKKGRKLTTIEPDDKREFAGITPCRQESCFVNNGFVSTETSHSAKCTFMPERILADKSASPTKSIMNDFPFARMARKV